jgi:hypothetical protein
MGLSQQHSSLGSDRESLAVSISIDSSSESVTIPNEVQCNCTPASCVTQPSSVLSVSSPSICDDPTHAYTLICETNVSVSDCAKSLKGSHDGSRTSAEFSIASTPSALDHTISQPMRIEATVPAPPNAALYPPILGKMDTLLFISSSLTSRYREIFRTCSY